MRKLFVCAFTALLLVLSGCNSGSKPISITIASPTGAQALDLGQSFTITVQVNNDKMAKGATFTLSGVGTLSNQSASGATYTAPGTGPGGSATITITSATDPTKTATIMVTVTPPPSISNPSSTLAAGIQGTSYSATVTTTGGAGALTYSVTVGNFPPGLSINSSTGAITGTPTGTGTFSFTVQVKDSSTVTPQTSSKAFTITVNQQPTITSANTTTFVAGVAGTFKVTTTAIPTAALSETGSLPTGITFVDNGDGSATIAGTSSTTGSFPITIIASNGIGTNGTQSFTLIVGKAPTISSGASTTFTVGTAGTFSVTTTGFPAPSLSESGALPSGVTFTDNHNGTATLAGTPAANSGGSYPFTITASNGIGTNATQSFTLTVNQAPVITSGSSVTFTINTAGTFTVTSSGNPKPALSETGALPTGVTFVDNHNGTATLAGTPTVSGAFPITITANNGVSPNGTQSFTLTVAQAPAVSSAAATTLTVGTAGTFSVTTTGFPAPSLSETGALPGGVTFTDNHNGTATLAGTPAAGTGKVYSLTITATNLAGTNNQTFSLTVDQAPAITSASSASFSAGAAGTFTVTTSGFPAPALSESGSLPTGVTFVDNHNGTATLAGTTSTQGSFPISITANNGVSPNGTQSFTLTVNTAPAFTSANNATFTVGTAGTFTVAALGTPVPSFGETGALPSGVTFTDNHNGTATLAGTPAAGTGKVYSLTITATNTSGSTNQSFTLTVDQAPAVTSASSTTFTTGASASFTVMATGVPTPALSESGALPSGVTFVDNGNGTATLSGTPASNSAGSYPLTITANNGITPNATQSFTLTVNSAPIFSSGSSTTFTVGTAGTFTVTASGSPTFSVVGTLPSGVTLTDNHNGTATLAGNPAANTGGVYNFTIKAQNASGTTSQNFTLTVNQAPSITTSNTTTFAVGQFSTFSASASGYPAPTLSESGALPSGVTFTPATGAFSGTPATGTAGSYPITFTGSNGIGTDATQNFTLVVVLDPCASATSGGEALLNGQYAFVLKGVDNGTGAGETTPEPVVVGGVLTFNGSGSITAGTLDMNTYSSAGVHSQAVTSSTYKVDSTTQRACLDITTASGTQHYRASLGNISGGVASLGHMINFDPSGPFVAGILKKQNSAAFGTGSSQVSGTYVFGVSALQNSVNGSGKFGAVGYFTLSSGNVTGGEVDINGNGQLNGGTTGTSFPSPIPVSGTGGIYSISSTTGRGTLSFTPTGGSVVTMVLYIVSSSDVFAFCSDDQTDNNLFAGEMLQQSGAPFSANPLSGSFVGYDSGLGASSGRADINLLGPLTSGSNSLPFTKQRNDSGTFTTTIVTTATYSVDSKGRLLVSGGGSHNDVAYLVNTSEAFTLNSNPGVDSGFFQAQSGSPFSGSSANGTYAYGAIDPESSGTADNVGIAVFASPNVTVTEDKNASGSLSEGFVQSFTYAVDSTGLGTIPSGCSLTATPTTCNTILYVISPTKAVVIDTTSGNPRIQPADK